MSPVTDRSQAKKSGFAQVREALISFEGDVVSATFGAYPPGGMGNDGKPLPGREFFDVNNENVVVLETSEELAMDVSEWNFRVTCNDSEGSFWIDHFLASADEAGVRIPDGIVGKRVRWVKDTFSFTNKAGDKIDYTNFVIGAILGDGTSAVRVIPEEVAPEPTPPVAVQPEVVTPEEVEAEDSSGDIMDTLLGLAVGKTEAQFRSAASLLPELAGNPVLAMVKSGIVTQSFIAEGKLVLEGTGKTAVYTKVE